MVAEALRTWLPTVLAGNVDCFVSSQDIRRGDRGMDVIASELEGRDYGIVVLTSENRESPWINFEAGALGKSLGKGRVSPVLVDIARADVEGPLAQFQSTLLTDPDDFRQLVRDLAALTPGLPDETVDAMFEVKWPLLAEVAQRASGLSNPKTIRTTDSMLEEVLEVVRGLQREVAALPRGGFPAARLAGLEEAIGLRGSDPAWDLFISEIAHDPIQLGLLLDRTQPNSTKTTLWRAFERREKARRDAEEDAAADLEDDAAANQGEDPDDEP